MTFGRRARSLLRSASPSQRWTTRSSQSPPRGAQTLFVRRRARLGIDAHPKMSMRAHTQRPLSSTFSCAARRSGSQVGTAQLSRRCLRRTRRWTSIVAGTPCARIASHTALRGGGATRAASGATRRPAGSTSPADRRSKSSSRPGTTRSRHSPTRMWKTGCCEAHKGRTSCCFGQQQTLFAVFRYGKLST